MSNRVSIQLTKFVNQRDGSTTLGYRIFDDNGQSYNNAWDDIPSDDMLVLKRVLSCHDDMTEVMFDYIAENKVGIEIGDTWYTWEQIENIIKERYNG